jgi:hypothetical protein
VRGISDDMCEEMLEGMKENNIQFDKSVDISSLKHLLTHLRCCFETRVDEGALF